MKAKYDGRIVPIPPPKNILTTLNQEGTEFSEIRRKNLIIFMKKLTEDDFLKYTEEVNCFLFDDSKFIELKQESELRHSKDEGLVQKLSKMFNYNNNNKKLTVGIKEMNENEKEIYNQEVFLNITLTKMEDFLHYFLQYTESRKHLTQAKLSILSGFHNLCKYNYECFFYLFLNIVYFENLPQTHNKITELAQIEDENVKDMIINIENSARV